MSESNLQDANFWVILTELQRVLRENVKFVPIGEDQLASIVPESIVIRKLRAPRPDYPANTSETLPGWIISPGRVMKPSMEGNNAQDETVYRVILQLIDKDYDQGTHGLRSWLRWLESAEKVLNHWFASHQYTNSADCVRDNVASGFDVINDKEFVRHQNFIGGIVVDNFVWEGRGAT